MTRSSSRARRPSRARCYESNSYVLTSQAKEAGALAYRVGIVPDDPRRLVDSIEDQLVRADLVVTTRRHQRARLRRVRDVLTGLGTVDFEHLAMTPGIAQGHGVIGPDATPLFTLPGDPVGVVRVVRGVRAPGHPPHARARRR